MKKNIPVTSVIYEMLLEISQKSRKKPEVWIEEAVKQTYRNL